MGRFTNFKLIMATGGLAIILLIFILRFKIQIDFTSISGVLLLSPQLVDWIDIWINRDTKAINKLKSAYEAKDKEQDKHLLEVKERSSEVMLLIKEVQLIVDELQKYYGLYNELIEQKKELLEDKNQIVLLNAKIKNLETQQEKFLEDFHVWVQANHKKPWRK